MLIDTHCHLDFEDFDPDRGEVIARAEKAGIGYIINVGSSIEGTTRSLELAKEYDIIYSSVGIHPHDAKTATDQVISSFEKLADNKKVVAVGEVGLDYYRNLSPKNEQINTFKKFIVLAKKLGLPLIVHSRDAGSETLDILKSESGGGAKGAMHCFSGNYTLLKRCLELGLFISFTCNLTFKNAKPLQALAKEVPVERLLLETDAPFLAPEGFRGKRNEPAHITYLVEELARLKSLSAEDIGRITTRNAAALFGLPVADEGKGKAAYPIRDSLYLNITNRCTDNCEFCVRNFTDFVKGHNLRLAGEPAVEDILRELKAADKYKEVVFCGYGEPTLRLDVIKAVAGELKKRAIPTRLVTNGHGDLINGRPIAGELKGLVDKVSVSLHVDSKEKYNKICRPSFGPDTYDAVLKFAKDCAANGIATEATCLDLPETDIEKCRAIARDIGATFRERKYGAAG